MSTSLFKKFLRDHGQDDATLSLRSGPGAPIFEAGPSTRIRRTPVRSIATLSWVNGPREVFGQVVNLSPGGCLIKTESTIADGTAIEMTITVLGNGRTSKIDIRGQILRQTTAEGRRAYGVEFVPENSADRESLQWLYSEASR
ncbi:MAG: PilZ domain-containing protein [Bradymonadaceae bacterium]|nr:PilZ domain-containing protein [Lujinxingiaceae bacterium]